MIKAILFDVDGVLIDPHEALIESFKATLEHFGFYVDKNDILQHKGLPGKDWIRELVRDSVERGKQKEITYAEINEELISKMRDWHLKYYLRIHPKYAKTLADIELLKLLKRKYKMAVVTNSSDEEIHKILEGKGLSKVDGEPLFDIIVAIKEGIEPKPSPHMINIVINELGVHPSEVLFAGDTEKDILAGKAAGVLTCLVGGEKIEETPNHQMNSINDLPDLLKKIRIP